MSNSNSTSANSDDSKIAAEPLLEGLLILLAQGQQLDPSLAAMLAPLSGELFGEIDPQDAIERMLAAQIIATFNRSMFLSRHANTQKNSRWFALYSRECDRAMNLCRKQMQMLADYRRPRRTSFTAIRNANIAGQQVITAGPFPQQKSFAKPQVKNLQKRRR